MSAKGPERPGQSTEVLPHPIGPGFGVTRFLVPGLCIAISALGIAVKAGYLPWPQIHEVRVTYTLHYETMERDARRAPTLTRPAEQLTPNPTQAIPTPTAIQRMIVTGSSVR